MAFSCCSNCLPLLLEYHSTSLDLERKLQMQKIELSRLQFEKQIRDIANNSLPIASDELICSHNNSSVLYENRVNEVDNQALNSENIESGSPAFLNKNEKFIKTQISLHSDESYLKSSLEELKESLNSLVASSKFFASEFPEKKTENFKLPENHSSSVDPQEIGQSLDSIIKFSPVMSPLKASDLKNNKENADPFSIEKPIRTPLSDKFDFSGRLGSSFNRALFTLEELQDSLKQKLTFE